jgi:ankyrin repeat protein
MSRSVVEAYETESPEGRNPLHDACLWGANDLIRPLLSFPEIDINRTTQLDGRAHQPPLFMALSRGDEEIMQVLLDEGAEITSIDASGRNILHYVISYMPTLTSSFLEQLRRIGRETRDFVNAGTLSQGHTPFDVAVQTGNFECADTLLSHNAQYTDLHGLVRLGSGIRAFSTQLVQGSR